MASLSNGKLVKLRVGQLDWSYAEIIFPAIFATQGISIRMLQWLDGTRTPPKHVIIQFLQTQNLTN